jgi:DNA-binding winged helix-turn-helix (wHTH) protein
MSRLQRSVSPRKGQPYPNGRAHSALRGAEFGVFEVNFRNRELRRNGVRVKLPEKPFQILEALLEKAGDMVRREELRKKLWPHTHVAFDRSINTAVTQLRRALDDPAYQPHFIETRYRLGYRFVAPVKTWNGPELRKVPRPVIPIPQARERNLLLMLFSQSRFLVATPRIMNWFAGNSKSHLHRARQRLRDLLRRQRRRAAPAGRRVESEVKKRSPLGDRANLQYRISVHFAAQPRIGQSREISARVPPGIFTWLNRSIHCGAAGRPGKAIPGAHETRVVSRVNQINDAKRRFV